MATAIEIAKPSDRPDAILLCGISDLGTINKSFQVDLDSGDINSDNTFERFFNKGEKFHYTLCSFKNGNITRYESGIGYYEDGHIIRYNPICCGRDFSQRVQCNNKLPYDFRDPTVVFASSPKLLSDLLFSENNFISSKCCNLPVAIEVQPNSVVGRLDGPLSSIDLNSPEFVEVLVKAITQYSKQLSLKSSKLDAKLVSTSALQLKPNNGNVKKGTLVYDETSDTIKFYNGTTWRTLTWVEDENAE